MLPTSTRVSVSLEKSVPASAAGVALFVVEKSRSAGEGRVIPPALLAGAERLLSAGLAKGKAREVVVDVIDGRHLFLVGLGPEEKISADVVREAGAALARAARKARVATVAAVTPQALGMKAKASLDEAGGLEAMVTGFKLAAFRYEEYKGTVSRKREEGEETSATKLILVPTAPDAAIKAAVQRAEVVADAQNFARTIASRPGNDISPPTLAKVAGELAREAGLKLKVLDEKELARLGMGGILAVGGGSERPPRLIVLEHNPSKGKSKSVPLLVVGKAITFDTGGISIKPAEKMGRMIFDKCGAMAVLGLMYAVGKLKLPVHVVGMLSSAENTLSGRAYRPGDILRMYNGVTVEVTNTDAEGRLVLGDALAWGIETYKPAAVLDLATLTGGVVVALGKSIAGVMSNSDGLMGELESAAKQAGEKIWRLPLYDEHRELIKSDCADIVNSGAREAHPLQGGAFLSHFVPTDGKTPWAHLDIAGVADCEKELPLYAKGATGWGVRTLVEWVESRKG